jgi:hydrogenase nickel incorporation protein HypA/HybF
VHELAVCQGLIAEVERVARAHRSHAVQRVRVAVGALSGVEPELLARAFDIARAGTLAARAQLDLDVLPVRVACTDCGDEAGVAPNRLLCPACGSWRVRVVGGDDMLLMQVELAGEEPVAAAG